MKAPEGRKPENAEDGKIHASSRWKIELTWMSFRFP